MNHKVFNFILFFLIYVNNGFGQSLPCFTHPLKHLSEPISIYKSPFVYQKELYMDDSEEGGYEVCAIRRTSGFIQCWDNINPTDTFWVHIGDVGVIIQNYNHDTIPIYDSSTSQTVICALVDSYLGIVYNWNDSMALLKVLDWDWNPIAMGWLHRKYLCSSPRTTCP